MTLGVSTISRDRRKDHTMHTVSDTIVTRKVATAYYGILDDVHGIFLQADDAVWFREDATAQWREVDLPTLARWAVLYGRVDLADAAVLADGDRVRRCSQTLQHA